MRNCNYYQPGSEKGFKIFFQGNECALESRNSKSTELNPEAVSKKLQKELDKERIASPFIERLFGDNFKCSPLSIRDKQYRMLQYHLVHNFS